MNISTIYDVMNTEKVRVYENAVRTAYIDTESCNNFMVRLIASYFY